MNLKIHNRTRGLTLADQAQLASDSASRRKGLLGRNGLAKGEGLLIHPCEAIHTFGMRFPIDVLFLNDKRQVVKLRANMGKSRVAFSWRASTVLELPSGTLEETGTQVGDQCEFEKLT